LDQDSLVIDGTPVSQTAFTKSLGFYIDRNLSWNVHFDNLCKKIAASIGVLKRFRPFVPSDTLQNMYNSLGQPHFRIIPVARFWYINHSMG